MASTWTLWVTKPHIEIVGSLVTYGNHWYLKVRVGTSNPGFGEELSPNSKVMCLSFAVAAQSENGLAQTSSFWRTRPGRVTLPDRGTLADCLFQPAALARMLWGLVAKKSDFYRFAITVHTHRLVSSVGGVDVGICPRAPM